MSDETIEKYINRLNDGNYEETIFFRHLSKSVIVSKVWDKLPELSSEIVYHNPSDKFYFIKNSTGKYIGAVYDMKFDLHWYITISERGKGYLTKSLRETILPDIFYEEDENGDRVTTIKKITINPNIGRENYKNSKRVADKLGFKSTNKEETEFELMVNDFDWSFENFDDMKSPLTANRNRVLQERLNLNFRQLYKISDELLMRYDNDESLNEIVSQLRYFHAKIDNIVYENK